MRKYSGLISVGQSDTPPRQLPEDAAFPCPRLGVKSPWEPTPDTVRVLKISGTSPCTADLPARDVSSDRVEGGRASILGRGHEARPRRLEIARRRGRGWTRERRL
jgi:hypothetical protein